MHLSGRRRQSVSQGTDDWQYCQPNACTLLMVCVRKQSGRGTTARHAFQFRLCAFSPDDPDADIGVDAYMIGAAIHLFKMASSLLMEYHPGLLLNADMVG